MKTRQTLALIVVLLTFFTVTLRAQTADVSEGCFPLLVNFTAPSGSSGFFWDFKDGVTVQGVANPAHSFSNAGVFEVEYREVENGPIVGTVPITIYEQPVISAATDPSPASGCAPLNINFQNTSVVDPGLTVTSYNWVFGDASPSSNLENPSHTFPAGTFTVSLEIKTNIANCQGTDFVATVNVSSQPNTSFTTNPNPPTSCTAPLTVSFNNTTPEPGLTYMWDFGNGNTSTDFNPADQTFTEDGLYPVQLTATDANGCSRTVTRNVSVGNPLASFEMPDTVCVGAPIQIINNSATGAYNWDFGPNATPGSSNTANPVVIFDAGGFQTVTLDVTANGGCMGDTTRMIFVEVPDPTFTTDPTFSCVEPLTINFTANGSPQQMYQWVFQDDSTSMEMNPVHSYFNDDTTTYSMNGIIRDTTFLYVTTPAGCIDSFFHIDTLWQPNALFMPDLVDGCAPLDVVFSDSSTSSSNIVSWEYDFGDGVVQSFTNDDDVMHTFTNAGEYDVILNIENANGCLDTSYAIRIEVGNTIVPDFSVDQTEVCPGDTVHFVDLTANNDIDGWHFSTEDGRTFHCFQESELFYAFDNLTGPQDVTLTVDYNGCFSSTTREDLIQVNGPMAFIDYEIDCTQPFNVAFRDSSMDATMVTWDFGDSTTSNTPDLFHLYDTTGNYTVILTAENDQTGCPASMDTMTVFVRDIEASFEIDSFICQGDMILLDGGMSQDVEASCWRGFDWHFTFNRPITTQDTVTEMVFGSPGDHTVTLVTRDINGCRDTTEQDVWVFSGSPSFTVSDDTVCLPAMIDFTQMNVADTTVVSWEWDFGDGSAPSTALDPSHTYGSSPPQDITVTLTITDAVGCPWPASETITVYEPTSTISTIPDPNICVGSELEFTATDFTAQGSNLTFDWDFGNGQTSMLQVDTALYDVAGTFNVVLNIQEIATGCVNSIPFLVDVQEFPIADYITDVDGIDPLCHPVNVDFTDNTDYMGAPSSTQIWNFDNGGPVGMGPNVATAFDKGIFNVELIASTSYGCRDTFSREFNVVGPEGDFTIDRDLICKGESITFELIDPVDITSFEWDFGDGIVQQGGAVVTHQYDIIPMGGTTIVKLTLKGENDVCEFIIEKPITIREVIADFVQDSICFEEGVPFEFVNTSLGNVNPVYTWEFGDGNTSTESDPNHVYAGSGSYEVQLTIEDQGCNDTLAQTVEVFAQPDLSFEGDIICQGDAATLNASSSSTSASFLWLANGVAIDSMVSSITVSPSTTTEYQVIVEDLITTCQTNETATVSVITIPQFGPIDTVICPGSTVALPVLKDSLINFEWTARAPANITDLSCLDCSLPFVVVNGAQEYQLLITDAQNLGCPSTTSSFRFDIPDESYDIPNAFTPDDDGLNDIFNVVLKSEETNVAFDLFQVFNRFGNLVYDNGNPTVGWDGTHSGKPAPSDVYLYHLEVSIEGCPGKVEKGQVTLIR